jgi:hypothetical protein
MGGGEVVRDSPFAFAIQAEDEDRAH